MTASVFKVKMSIKLTQLDRKFMICLNRGSCYTAVLHRLDWLCQLRYEEQKQTEIHLSQYRISTTIRNDPLKVRNNLMDNK